MREGLPLTAANRVRVDLIFTVLAPTIASPPALADTRSQLH